jgi:hypothetical protein
MKAEEMMFNRQRAVLILVMTIFFCISSVSHAQHSKEISLSFYPGFTPVNFEKALGYSDDNMEDWSQFYYSLDLRGFLSSEIPFQFGTELAWQRLYYAYYVVPYGPSPVYREFNVSTVSLMVLGRYSVNKFFVVGGAGIHFFNSGISPAICLEAGYMIKAGANLGIPVSLRINPVFADGTPIPISVGIGASCTFGKKE